jgi:hypothetical protein
VMPFSYEYKKAYLPKETEGLINVLHRCVPNSRELLLYHSM